MEYDPEEPEINNNTGTKIHEDDEYDPESPQWKPDPEPVYQDMLCEKDITTCEKKGTMEEFLVKPLQAEDKEQQFYIQTSQDVVTEYTVPFKKIMPKMKLCIFFARGHCKKGYTCRFFHGPQQQQQQQHKPTTSMARKRRNYCQMKGCNAFCSLDICQECCIKYDLCENRPCGQNRTNKGKEPTLCHECYEREKNLPRKRLCKNPSCRESCLSFHMYCRNCFNESKNQNQNQCKTPGCTIPKTRASQRYCRVCSSSARSKPY